MIEACVCVRFIDQALNLKVVEESVAGIEHVEQLVYRILDREGVGPIYRSLFALKLIPEDIWLAPNASLKVIHRWSRECAKALCEPQLELRMRFLSHNYVKIQDLDSRALEVIFAQVRADFLRSRFNDERRSQVMLDEPVISMIVLDLVRYAIEREVSLDKLLDSVESGDFLPKRAIAWQRAVIFHIATQMNLEKAIRKGYDSCGSDVVTLKRRYIEMFFACVADRYGVETYIVHHLPQATSGDSVRSPRQPELLNLRVRLLFSEERTSFVIETSQVGRRNDDNSKANKASDKKKNKNKYKDKEEEDEHEDGVEEKDNDNEKEKEREKGRHKDKRWASGQEWVQICDIETITHATTRRNIVQLARSNGYPVRYQFKTRWHAESFLSLLDGYYRLMRGWSLNLFRDIWSPSLVQLKRMASHGPIGSEMASRKLVEHELPDQFLVRQCTRVNHRYLVDTHLFNRKVMLTIHIDKNPSDQRYRQTGFTLSRGGFEIDIETQEESYMRLKNLINDINITVRYKSQGPLKKQLKHWISPEDDDRPPLLMLSISEMTLVRSEAQHEASLVSSPLGLPRVVPHHALSIVDGHFGGSANNGLAVDLAIIKDIGEVVVKEYLECKTAGDGQAVPAKLDASGHSLSFHVCPEALKGEPNGLALNQIHTRVADWPFIKTPLIAKNIGYLFTSGLLQEHFRLGSLDQLLGSDQQIDVKLSSCFQLIEALLFLDKRKIIHGKIRCHNVMVQQLHPFQVKLSDPLGRLDVVRDQAFIPPEYISGAIDTCVRRYYSGADVWALGTTMWQIFSAGSRPPPGCFANRTLTQPVDCPNEIWRTVESCWTVEPKLRATPRTLYRDITDLFAWEKGSHEYFYISPEDSEQSSSTHNGSPSLVSETTLTQATPLTTSARLNGSSTNGTSINGSHQVHPTRSSASDGGNDSASISSSGSGTTTTSRSDALMISNQTGAKKTSWRNFMHLTMMQRPFHNGLPPRNNFHELFGSSSSLDTCETPNGSDVTRLTLLELENISEAFDQCVWQVNSSRLKLGAEIGRGSCGVVIKGVLSGQTNGRDGGDQVVAVKCIDKTSANYETTHTDDLRREFDILKNLDHPNIVKALGYVDESQMMLIFEYMPLGSLLSCVKKIHKREDLNRLPLKKYALDIANGMEYLESMKIVHRDLALRNILLNSREEVKICDFGLAKSLGSENFYQHKTERALPFKWYAPETISSQVFTHKSDVWSYGVVLWEIYTGGDNPQYSGTYANLAETLKKERLPKPAGCSIQVYDLMLKCWAYQPGDRMTFKQVREYLERSSDFD